MDNKYTGFKLYEGWTIDRVSSNISPEDFFLKYVSQRKPVIITDHLKDEEWKGYLWTNSYLKEKAGESIVNVEEKGNNGSFGTSLPRNKMKFGDLIDKINEGSTQNYLTTQYEDDNDDTVREFCPPPLNHLIGDFPYRPSILGNLIVQSVNVWFGHSANGTSSGLHHDFHDNLYILLRGHKRFTIFSPNDAQNLYTFGKIKKVYKNGLICYEEDDVREDGAPMVEVIRHNSYLANRKYDEAVETGDEEIIEIAQKEMDAAMEELFEYEANFGDEDDFSIGSVSDISDGPIEITKSIKNTQKDVAKEPNSFSKIDYESLHSKIAPKNFSNLNKATRYQFEIKSGEMLFLPSGWFHEVTSYSDDNNHLAFNYWCSPSSTNNYSSPYVDSFWHDKWEELKLKLDTLKALEKKRGTNDAFMSSDTTKKRKR